jgi:outer membrane immunogenic protein
MRKLILGTTFSLAMVVGASAADLPAYTPSPAPVYSKAAPPAFSWTGFYLGGDLGMRAVIVDPTITGDVFTSSSGTLDEHANLCLSSFSYPCPSATQLNNIALRTGVFGGYNLQLGRWVLGVEGGGGYANESGTINGAFYPGGDPFLIPATGDSTFTVKTTWDADAVARLGYLIAPNILTYATGGASWLQISATSNCPTATGGGLFPNICSPAVGGSPAGFSPASITNSTTRLGWTIGGGLEANVWGNWLLRADYKYANYGTWHNTDTRTCVSCVFAPFAGLNTLTVGYDLSVQTHTATFGLAYKF